MPGPPPKRQDQRRRVNKPEVEVEQSAGADVVEPPQPSDEWHPVARAWFGSLAVSGQSVFYEPSDWALAAVVAEAMSRELQPQPMTVGRGEDATVMMVTLPPKGASMAAWLKAMTALMVTEGDRRRLRLELVRQQGPDREEAADVSELDAARRRLRGGAG